MSEHRTSETASGGLPPHLWKPIANTLAAMVTLSAIAWAFSLQRQFGIGLYPQQFYAAILMFSLPVAFLTMPARREETRTVVPWYDVVLAAASLVAVGYVLIRYPDLVLQIFTRPLAVWLPSIVVVLLTLEALRRATARAQLQLGSSRN